MPVSSNARHARFGIEGTSPTAIPIADVSDSNIAVPSAPEKKIALFRSLFRGREDVYAVRWEGKGGKSGYSPVGVMDWRAIHAAKTGRTNEGCTEDADASTAHR